MKMLESVGITYGAYRFRVDPTQSNHHPAATTGACKRYRHHAAGARTMCEICHREHGRPGSEGATNTVRCVPLLLWRRSIRGPHASATPVRASARIFHRPRKCANPRWRTGGMDEAGSRDFCDTAAKKLGLQDLINLHDLAGALGDGEADVVAAQVGTENAGRIAGLGGRTGVE